MNPLPDRIGRKLVLPHLGTDLFDESADIVGPDPA